MSSLDSTRTLFQCSWWMVRQNKKLAFFTAANTAGMFFLMMLPIFLAITGADDAQGGGHQARQQPFTFLVLGNWRLAAGIAAYAFIGAFLNTAFYNEALHAYAGRPVSIRRGMLYALSRWRSIAAWVLFASLIGWGLQLLEERLGFVGRWVLRVIGVAWGLASIFAIPVIVREGGSPLAVLRKSARIVRGTWGETLAGFASIAILGWVMFMLVLILMLFVAACLNMRGQFMWLMAPFFLAWIFVQTIANDMFKAALFIYATEGEPPWPFDKDEMDMAWNLKKGRAIKSVDLT